jgi:multicomponent Na+:H+ antiporter subunit E
MPAPGPTRDRVTLRNALVRATAFAALWWVLSEGRGGGWVLAALSLVAATLTSLALAPAARAGRVGGMARFAGFFLGQALLGGVDVARRALDPRLPIHPGFSEYRVRIAGATARMLLLNTVSLLPGTLAAHLRGDVLLVHALDSSETVADRIAAIEERVAAALGVELPDPPGG